MISRDAAPLIVHVVYRFAVGGLENGVVNLINSLPAERWRHAVLALDEISVEFCARVKREDVTYIALHKRPGHLFAEFPRLFHVFRELRPAIVHTRNLAALEAIVPAWAAGVPVRIHGEHGRDASDPDGTNRKQQWVRRLYRPFVQQYVALSFDLERYLQERVGVRKTEVRHIFNGVDAERFPRRGPRRESIAGAPFDCNDGFVFGTVGRLDPVKDQATLVRAFAQLRASLPVASRSLRLVIVGEGPQRALLERTARETGVADLVWLAGERSDIPALLRGFDCFVLPSMAEGISNTILEAMSSGLPVVATRVGANPDLVSDGHSGQLVARSDVGALAAGMMKYAVQPLLARTHGDAGRRVVESRFSLDRMVGEYDRLYDEALRLRVRRHAPARLSSGARSTPLKSQRH